jgi:cytochrome c oxidase subunit 2
LTAAEYSLPPEFASSFAAESDVLFSLLLFFSLGLGTFLTFLVVYYGIKYRRGSPASRQGRRARNFWLEVGWTGGSLAAAFGLFAWGAQLYLERYRPPANAMHILGVGKRWMWKFQHAGGEREINELHLPVGRPVLIELASEDVIHSFFVPAFRVKQDAVPGLPTNTWFEATKTGRFHLFCAEFCGTAHSGMTGWVTVLTPEAYTEWLAAQPSIESPAAEGERLFRALGCSGCHEGAKHRAPPLQGVYGHPIALENGTVVTADARYIRDSILQPSKEIVAGYDPIMPSFAGYLDDAEIMALMSYISSLSTASSAP